ncbi:MAG: TerB family tellurite resistance protein [Myxococcales bacterium]|nr:TerB family tellurite resistance protein [Myxococcales bacterium]
MFGKVLGAIIGAIIGLGLSSGYAAIVLAAVGAYLGHRFDLAQDAAAQAPEGGDALPEPRSKREVEREARALFARHLCTLFAEVAKVDGAPVREEIRAVRDFFERELRFDEEELETVRVDLKQAFGRPGDLEAATLECRAGLRPSERLLLASALYELGLADGVLKRPERDLIRKAVGELGISEEEHRSILAAHLGDGQPRFAVLGLSADATDEELKSAFRRLAATHHPDKVAHLGPGAVERASRRFREIKEAYDEARRIRGG